MAGGQPFDADAYTAAHKSLPFGTKLEVSHGDESVRVTFADRGPYVVKHDLDLPGCGAADRPDRLRRSFDLGDQTLVTNGGIPLIPRPPGSPARFR
jgi:hypothetical protein